MKEQADSSEQCIVLPQRPSEGNDMSVLDLIDSDERTGLTRDQVGELPRHVRRLEGNGDYNAAERIHDKLTLAEQVDLLELLETTP